MAKRNALKEKCYAFAIRVIRLSKFLKEEKCEYVFSKQIV